MLHKREKAKENEATGPLFILFLKDLSAMGAVSVSCGSLLPIVEAPGCLGHSTSV